MDCIKSCASVRKVSKAINSLAEPFSAPRLMLLRQQSYCERRKGEDAIALLNRDCIPLVMSWGLEAVKK